MFDEFEALAALKKYETLSIAGAHLRVEASTVWKRIQLLEKTYGHKLLEKRGRNAYLTPLAERLLSQASPHLQALQEVLHNPQDSAPEARPLRVGLSESIALSWGPKLLKELSTELREKNAEITYELSTHRGLLLIEKLRHGDFDFIICAGTSMEKSSLVGEKLFDEELLCYKSPATTKIYCIEETALSFEWVKDEIDRLLKTLRKNHDIEYLQSYGAIASLILNEIAGGIIPRGVAQRFRVPQKLLSKGTKKLERPIYLYSKKSFYTSTIGNKVFELCRKISREGPAYLQNFK